MGDLLFTTDNSILLDNHVQLDALCCIQKKAKKKVVTEEDIIQANNLGFGNEAGTVTNHTTSQVTLRASFPKGSKEYNVLTYRIQCGQNYNQNAVDKCKGVISRKMPYYWYNKNGIRFDNNDTPEERELKELYWRICSDKRPYFFAYLYPSYKREYEAYEKRSQTSAGMVFGKSIDELKASDSLTEEEEVFMKRYYKRLPLDCSPSVMNNICWEIEKAFDGMSFIPNEEFDYTVLKAGVGYDQEIFNAVLVLYGEYKKQIAIANKIDAVDSENNGEINFDKEQAMALFSEKCVETCPNELELCDILIDAGYTGKISKNLVWYVVGETILHNLLEKSNYMISYPELDKNGDIKCCNGSFSMRTIEARW